MNAEVEPGAYPIHDFSPFLVRFTEDLGVRYYGLAYVLGFLIAAGLIYRAAKRGRAPLKPVETDAFLFYLVVGVLVGGRLGSILFYDLGAYLEDPLRVFAVWKGGMASHGGFVGVCVAAWLFAWRHRRSPFALGDAIVMAAPPGLLLGRIANFINGELWGKVTTVPWAWIFPDAPPDYGKPGYHEPALNHAFVNPRHPSQLYEAALEGLLLGAYLLWRYWRRRPARQGQLVAEFLIGYAILRIVGEWYREPDAGVALILGLSRGTVLSVLTLVIGVVFLVWLRRHGTPPQVRPGGS